MRANFDSDRPGERVPTNAEVHAEITGDIVQEVLGLSDQSRLKVGPLKILDFSSIFSIDWGCWGERQGVFVKIPKVALHKCQVGSITLAHRRLALEEYNSLVRLYLAWKGADLGTSFVKPQAFLASCNAVVTQKVNAREFLAFFRRQDLYHRFRGPGPTNRGLGCLNRLGQSLAGYHQGCGVEGLFEAEAAEKSGTVLL